MLIILIQFCILAAPGWVFTHRHINTYNIIIIMAGCICRIQLIWRWRACMSLAWALHCLNADRYFNLQVWKERRQSNDDCNLCTWDMHRHTRTQSHTNSHSRSSSILSIFCESRASIIETCKDTVIITITICSAAVKLQVIRDPNPSKSGVQSR